MDADAHSDEKAVLLEYLDGQREHVLGIVEGLSEEDMRQAVLPSGWNCVGLVQHLALDVERWWFWRVMAGETDESWSEVEDGWQVSPDTPAYEVLELYRRECERATSVIAETSLDAAPAWWPQEVFGEWRLDNFRQLMMHVITETATHAGHLDAVRELIDGRTWLVLDG